MKNELLNKIESEINSKDKPLLNPKNNREYWLFTEYLQIVVDFFDEKEKVKWDCINCKKPIINDCIVWKIHTKCFKEVDVCTQQKNL